MSATTNLQFTLRSADTPTPTPTPTPNNTTTGTTTYVTSPNTGDNTTSDNGGGAVFMTLFAVIGLAALVVFLVKYLKKNRRLSFAEKGSFRLSARPRVFATVGLVLAIAFLGSSILIKSYTDERADAATSELAVSVTSDMTFDVDRGKTAFLTDNVTVTTGGNGYTLEVSTDNSKFCLSGSTTDCLSSTTGDITSTTTSGLSSLSTNQWGMSLLGQDTSAKIWAAVPTTPTVIQDKGSTSGEAEITKVYYGVNVGTNLPDGTYYGKVIYTAYSKDTPATDYKVTTVNGYVDATGTKTTNRYNEDVTVTIRPNCPADETFLGWTSSDINVASITGPTGNNLYQFVMPAKDVTVVARCSGDESEGKMIVYNANAPTGTTATGTTPDTMIEAGATTVTLRSNGFSIPGYTFKGWACSKTATTKDYDSAQANISLTAFDAKCPIDLEADIPTYTLYALWEPVTVTYLQEVTPEMCNNMNMFDVVTLKDRRDNKEYSYTKYADNRCWMLSDLDYRPTGSTTLTVADTDVSAERSVTFATSGTSGALYHTQTGYSTLYNYNAATAGYWSSWSSKSANKVVPDSLCPANWKIPDASHGPVFHEDTQTITNDTSYGTMSGELYGLWNYNAGKAYGYGKTATTDWKRQFMFGSGTFTTTTGNKTVTYPHFTYNGAWSFSSGNWADTSKGKSGQYASYFLSTTTTNSSNAVVPAAFNPHAPGVDT
ncbi:hypothetical protein IJ103_02455, partial [Candidatus Saccharibacteria bacterium]|nr:hypothetical protein [Candidatus Saccharibacteria bacterium]